MKRHQPSFERIRKVALFSACTDRQLAYISRRINEHRATAGDVLTGEGIDGRQFFAIVDGTATVLIGDGPVASLGSGDFFGELALLDWGTRTATVVADTDLVAMVCGVQEFDQILDFAPIVARKLLVGISRRLRAVDLALASGNSSSAAVE